MFFFRFLNFSQFFSFATAQNFFLATGLRGVELALPCFTSVLCKNIFHILTINILIPISSAGALLQHRQMAQNYLFFGLVEIEDLENFSLNKMCSL